MIACFDLSGLATEQDKVLVMTLHCKHWSSPIFFMTNDAQALVENPNISNQNKFLEDFAWWGLGTEQHKHYAQQLLQPTAYRRTTRQEQRDKKTTREKVTKRAKSTTKQIKIT